VPSWHPVLIMDDRTDLDVTSDDTAPEPAADPAVGDDGGGDAGGARPGMRLAALAFATGLIVIALDQLTKYLAVKELTGQPPVRVVDGIVQLHLIRTSGAAFSIATGMTWVLTALSATVCAVIARYAFRLGSAWWAIALGLMLGGAIGNLLDRFFRAPGFARGHVVDFIQLPHYPIFNVADSAVVTGAVMIAVLGFLGIRLDGRRQGA
jgi:signal peptidase II